MDMQQIMKQVQSMQKKITEAQEEQSNKEFEGSAGGDMVKATINGKGEFLKLKIDPSMVVAEDVETLEDLVIAAFNNAKVQSDSESSNALSDMAGKMGLPPGFKMPF